MINKLYTKRANFGMALPYFLEVVELQKVIACFGSPVAHSEIGQVFGKQTIIVFVQTVDGQTWRLIYPDETTACWVLPFKAKPSVQRVTEQKVGAYAHVTADT